MHIYGWLLAALALCLPAPAWAQRQLHWDRIDVEAHLDASGRLRVTETQAIVFTGDWNGGERRFRERPGQTLRFLALSRAAGDTWRPLRRDPSLDDVDEYSFTDPYSLRWRSRRRTERPFNQTRISYRLEYEWSGILQRDGDTFTLDHNFLFPDRSGDVLVLTLRLTLDPVWQPLVAVDNEYAAERIPPGSNYVVTLPLRYTGAVAPVTTGTSPPIAADASQPPAIDFGRRPEIEQLTAGLVAVFGLAVAWLFRRERDAGRFAPLHPNVDEWWLRAKILAYPAEVIGAAWDEDIGSAEVLALLARMERDGLIESEVTGSDSMTVRLKVSRYTLSGYERALVDALFFEDRVLTSTIAVKAHYRDTGFNPAEVIRPDLEAAVTDLLPGREPPKSRGVVATVLFVAGLVVLAVDAWMNYLTFEALLFSIGLGLLMSAARVAGVHFRSNIHWDQRAAALVFLPAVVAVAVTSFYLWYVIAAAIAAASWTLTVGLVLLTLAVVAANVDFMRSQRSPAAIAFRKQLAAARAFFAAQLRQPQPALRDEWLPWILAFGLDRQVDNWATQAATRASSSRFGGAGTSSSSAPGSPWGGFSGGRSGGAGAGAAWIAAASGVAAGVPRPSNEGGHSDGSGGGGW